jgi:hypothetical protein
MMARGHGLESLPRGLFPSDNMGDRGSRTVPSCKHTFLGRVAQLMLLLLAVRVALGFWDGR